MEALPAYESRLVIFLGLGTAATEEVAFVASAFFDFLFLGLLVALEVVAS